MNQYAGFWIRLCAFLIDSILINIVVGIFVFIAPSLFQFGSFTSVGGWGGWLLWVAYEALMTQHQRATIGKQVMGLIIVREDGGLLTVGQCWLRPVSQILSSVLLMIGYIMIAFTSKKQGLHDIICKTVVVYKNKTPAGVIVQNS